MVVEEERVNNEAFLNFESKFMSWLLHEAPSFCKKWNQESWIKKIRSMKDSWGLKQVTWALAYLHWTSRDIEDREVMSFFTLLIELGKTSNSSLQVFRIIWRIINWAVRTYWPNISAWSFLFKHNLFREGITIKTSWQCRSLNASMPTTLPTCPPLPQKKNMWFAPLNNFESLCICRPIKML